MKMKKSEKMHSERGHFVVLCGASFATSAARWGPPHSCPQLPPVTVRLSFTPVHCTSRAPGSSKNFNGERSPEDSANSDSVATLFLSTPSGQASPTSFPTSGISPEDSASLDSAAALHFAVRRIPETNRLDDSCGGCRGTVLRNPRRPSFNNRLCDYCLFLLCWSCHLLWTKKIQLHQRTLRIPMLSRHCTSQSQQVELPQLALQQLQQQRWVVSQALGPKDRASPEGTASSTTISGTSTNSLKPPARCGLSSKTRTLLPTALPKTNNCLEPKHEHTSLAHQICPSQFPGQNFDAYQLNLPFISDTNIGLLRTSAGLWPPEIFVNLILPSRNPKHLRVDVPHLSDPRSGLQLIFAADEVGVFFLRCLEPQISEDGLESDSLRGSFHQRTVLRFSAGQCYRRLS